MSDNKNIKAVSREEYDRFVLHFRKNNGAVKTTAKEMGISYSTASRAWNLGFMWSPDLYCRRPIKDVFEEEQILIRKKLDAEEEKNRALEEEDRRKKRLEAQEKALMDVLENRVQEAQMIRLSRGSAMATLSHTVKMGQNATKLNDKIDRYFSRLAERPEELSHQDVLAIVRIMGQVTKNLQASTDAANKAMQMERLLLGEPTQIVGHAHALNTDMTLEEAERRINAAAQALAFAQGKVVYGGELQTMEQTPALRLISNDKKD